MNFCKDCKWLRPPIGGTFNGKIAQCDNPIFQEGNDPVSGELLIAFSGFCSMLRNDTMFCGKEGRHFELAEVAKDVPQ